MGKKTGFFEFKRTEQETVRPEIRIQDFREFHLPLQESARREQGGRCMDCGVPFCQSGMMMGGMVSGCPLHNLIPEWNDMIYSGNWKQAYDRLKKTNSFPEFTCRVCPAPCEAACTCGLDGAPVTIRDNEMAVAQKARELGLDEARPPRIRTGKTVAVIGSGPAGLAAADQLNKRGHSVTIFEREDRIGGLLMYGIPNMKLEKQVIERKVRIMEKEGVRFVTHAEVGRNYDAEEIINQFDSVILACGASAPRDLPVPGRESDGVYFAVDFLKSTTKSLLDSGLEEGTYLSAKDKRVLVVGGGDTGNDCVATAIRHGCASVIQLEMMPEPPAARTRDNPWPQWPRVKKTDYGQEEAIAVFGSDPRMYQTTVKELTCDEQGKVVGAVLVSLQPKKEKDGKIRMIPVEGSEQETAVDLVLIAAGFTGAQEDVLQAFGAKMNEKGTVCTPEHSYQTSREKVFAAGDIRRGASLVVWAIREGREAAGEVDKTLMGYTNLA